MMRYRTFLSPRGSAASAIISREMSQTVPISKTIPAILLSILLLAGIAAAQQYDDQAEQQLVQLLNQERSRAGLPSLKLDDRLTKAARAHSVPMANAQQLSHQFPGEPPLMKRLAAAGVRLNNDAENVAFGDSVHTVHDGLMHSPPHRENILSPKYNTVGVGAVRSGDYLWVTEDFAHRLEDYSVDDAENAIIAAWERQRRRARGFPAPVERMPLLRRMACDMAKQDRLDTRTPLALPNVQAAVVYTESDPVKLAPNAVKMAHDPSVKRLGIGACFARGENYPAGGWWVAMVFY